MLKGEKVALYGIFANAFLGAAKLGLSQISGSLALKADAYHSFMDIIVSLVVFLGMKIAKLKAKSFPFGLYKIENLLSVLIGIIMTLAGVDIIRDALYGRSVIVPHNLAPTLVGVIILTALNYLWSQYKIKIGQEINSPSLQSDGYHSRIETYALLLIVVGLVSSTVSRWSLDGVIAVLIALSIFKSSGEIIWQGVKILLDAGVEKDIYQGVRKVLEQHSRVEAVEEILIRYTGKYLLVEAEVVLTDYNMYQAEQVKHELEEAVKSEIGNVERLTIVYRPREIKNYAFMVDNENLQISKRLASAPYICFYNGENSDKIHIVPNPVIKEERHKGIRLIDFLLKQDVQMVVCRGNLTKRAAGLFLQNAGIGYEATDLGNVQDFIHAKRLVRT